MTGDTTMSKMSRLDVIATGSRRRWSSNEKHRIVGEALSAPRNVSATARRHGLAPSQLFTWCRLARAGRLPAGEEMAFTPAIIARGFALTAGLEGHSGVMEIALCCGRSIRVDASVDAAALKRVITVLEGAIGRNPGEGG